MFQRFARARRIRIFFMRKDRKEGSKERTCFDRILYQEQDWKDVCQAPEGQPSAGRIRAIWQVGSADNEIKPTL
jgi:hypothetical protein